jgi:single-stranded-DNA-specific exonuclease
MLRDVFLEKILVIDATIGHSLVSLATAMMIESFAPFGLGNAQPNFLIKDVQLKNYRFLGVNQQHLKMTVLVGAEELPVLAWSETSLLEEISINDRFDLVCQLQVNEYRGKASLQLVYKDLQKTRT